MTDSTLNKTKTNDCDCDKKDTTLASVVIATHNRADLLNKAVRSILNQTYQDFEIIIIDDASGGDTEQVIKSFNNKKIIYQTGWSGRYKAGNRISS